MVAMKDYPADPMPFYAQGFSLVEYLLEYGKQFDGNEHRRLVRFAQSAMQDGNWQSALQEHYNVHNLGELQTSWVKWVGTDDRTLQAAAEVPTAEPANWQTSTAAPIASMSAKPVPPPNAKSVYDRKVETIPVSWNDEHPLSIPVSYGRDIVLR